MGEAKGDFDMLEFRYGEFREVVIQVEEAIEKLPANCEEKETFMIYMEVLRELITLNKNKWRTFVEECHELMEKQLDKK